MSDRVFFIMLNRVPIVLLCLTGVCHCVEQSSQCPVVSDRFPNVLPILDPDIAVDRIMDAILCNQAMIILPRFLYIGYALKG